MDHKLTSTIPESTSTSGAIRVADGSKVFDRAAPSGTPGLRTPRAQEPSKKNGGPQDRNGKRE
jgi:hypothetical protein